MLETLSEYCPYCGEAIELVVDCSLPQQRYTEDCSVCCQPMVVLVNVDQDDTLNLTLLREDDATYL